MMLESSRANFSDRTVIFVGGTAYSGSTLADMILANDPTGFSCGEVYAIFYPFRPHHLRLDELGSSVDWRAIKKAGPKRLYTSLFEQFPNCRFIVDSSKSPLWISDRTKELHQAGISTKNILIWKTPSEFLASRRKRGREARWKKEWIGYHRFYFSRIESWRSVRYRDLVNNKETLPQLCQTIGVPYFAGKERYWETSQHTVFGNDTTRIHLYDPSSDSFAEVTKSIVGSGVDLKGPSAHRTISYAPVPDWTPGPGEGIFKTIADVLEARDVFKTPRELPSVASEVAALRIGKLLQAYKAARLKLGLSWVVDALRG